MMYHTELYCILQSYATPYWATLHFSELCCPLLINAAPYCAMMYHTELYCILQSYATPYWATLHSTSYAAPYWAMLHPTELCCALLSYAAPYWAILHPTALRCTLLSLSPPTGICNTLLNALYTFNELQHLSKLPFPKDLRKLTSRKVLWWGDIMWLNFELKELCYCTSVTLTWTDFSMDSRINEYVWQQE